MKKYWIVIADAGRALVLNKVEGNSPAGLVHDLENPAGRMKTSQLVSDESGRMAKMRGGSKSAMDPPHRSARAEGGGLCPRDIPPT